MMTSDRTFACNDLAITEGPVVIYRMSRDQRVWDNHALLAAATLAVETGKRLKVVFCLNDSFPRANLRSFDFMIRGLKSVSLTLSDMGIDFVLLKGDPLYEVPAFVERTDCAALFSDFDPLRIKQQWTRGITEKIPCAHFEVDTHNIVPCRVVSPKQEYGAYTLRPKIHKLLPIFLNDLPGVDAQRKLLKEVGREPGCTPVDAGEIISGLRVDRSVSALSLPSGYIAAHEAMHGFVTGKLNGYDQMRNFPEADHQSNLSAYLHFGQISAQRLALEVQNSGADESDRNAFLEQLIVRKELSDNYCFYNPYYDQWEGAPGWARETLLQHLPDERDYIYQLPDFEDAGTHDPLWNAAQRQLRYEGRIHGYMRMYWAKKILEWSISPQEALQRAIYLNDKYALDGRDPNGYVGCQWAICGLHDRPWTSRPVFGKIRFMNDKGCSRKFDVKKYIGMY